MSGINTVNQVDFYLGGGRERKVGVGRGEGGKREGGKGGEGGKREGEKGGG